MTMKVEQKRFGAKAGANNRGLESLELERFERTPEQCERRARARGRPAVSDGT